MTEKDNLLDVFAHKEVQVYLSQYAKPMWENAMYILPENFHGLSFYQKSHVLIPVIVGANGLLVLQPIKG